MQTVFLDDLGRNLRPAREVGMVTVRVRETEEALRELETLLGVSLVEEGGKGILLLLLLTTIVCTHYYS